jgi:LacI family transcriptional regulator
VSQALVSLVLNGRKAGINPETYDRIWDHAVKRGYTPKGMHLPASPNPGQPRQVGFVLRAPLRLSIPSNYFGHVQNGLHNALEVQGYTSVFIGAEDQLNGSKLQRLFQPGHVFQGVVLMGEVARPFLDELRKIERRLVSVAARFPGLCHSVLGNEPQALEMIVRHLHELGHRRIGWLGGNVSLGRHNTRLAAFQSALRAFDLEFNPRYHVVLNQADRAEGAEAIHAMLPHAKRRDFPTAFVCYNCLMAAGAIKALEREGWKVPESISIVGADGSRVPIEDGLRITGAGASPERLGEAAAHLVLNSTGLDDESFHDVILPAQFLDGATTAPAPKP